MLRSSRVILAFLITGFAWVLFGNRLVALFAGSLTSVEQKIIDLVLISGAALAIYFLTRKPGETQTDDQYRKLFESNPNPLWVYENATLCIVKVNCAAVEKYLYSRDQFLQMTVMDIRPADDRQRLSSALKGRNGDFCLSGHWKHLKANGEIIETSIVSYPILFDGRQCSLVIATDITELVEKEKKLQEAYQKIKNFNDTLRQIAWSNSHEMRKPVCSIISLVSLLKHTENSQERRQYQNLLETAATELDDVLKQNEKMTEVESEVETL